MVQMAPQEMTEGEEGEEGPSEGREGSSWPRGGELGGGRAAQEKRSTLSAFSRRSVHCQLTRIWGERVGVVTEGGRGSASLLGSGSRRSECQSTSPARSSDGGAMGWPQGSRVAQ